MTIFRKVANDPGTDDARVSSGAALARNTSHKIAFVTNTGEYGGSERHLLDVVRKLIQAEPGVQISILCPAEDLYSKYLTQAEAARIKIVLCRGRLKSFGDWYRLFSTLHPDVVVFVRAWLWCYQWYVPIAARLAGIRRRVSIAHLAPPVVSLAIGEKANPGILLRFRRIAHLRALRLSARFENATICVSKAIRDALVNDYHFPADRTITIQNGVSLAELNLQQSDGAGVRAKLGLGAHEFLLVCIARLNQQKRIDILLNAMAQLMAGGVPCKCVIVGDGPLRENLVNHAAALGLNGCVFFEGFQEDPAQYLQAGTAFVLTSGVEGLPLALLEAMARGLPCIVTNVGGNAEAVTDRVHGLVVPAGSATEVASAIEYFVTHPDERAEMGKLARARVHEEFDIEKCMDRIKSVILG